MRASSSEPHNKALEPPASHRRVSGMNLLQRAGLCLVLSGPVLFAAWSFVGGNARLAAPGWALVAVAGPVAALNAYTSWFRPWLFKRRTGSLEGYRFVSGVPLVGTILLTLALVANGGERAMVVVVGVFLALDTGGAPWLIVPVWRNTRPEANHS